MVTVYYVQKHQKRSTSMDEVVCIAERPLSELKKRLYINKLIKKRVRA